jgi:hypothetical protein
MRAPAPKPNKKQTQQRKHHQHQQTQQPSITAFLAPAAVDPQQLAASTSSSGRQRKVQPHRRQQARLQDLQGVVALPRMSGHAPEAELLRLLEGACVRACGEGC